MPPYPQNIPQPDQSRPVTDLLEAHGVQRVQRFLPLAALAVRGDECREGDCVCGHPRVTHAVVGGARQPPLAAQAAGGDGCVIGHRVGGHARRLQTNQSNEGSICPGL
eukprot:5984812-Pyramimonas_sp.AAC.1